MNSYKTSIDADPYRQKITMAGALAMLALTLGGCAHGPEPAPDALLLPAAWRHAAAAPGWISAEQARTWAQGPWWRLWDDPVLDELMARVDVASPTLQLAASNVAQAEALLRQAQADGVPQLGLQLGQQRSGGDARPVTSSASLNLSASWAPDLWGRVRLAAAAQQASVQASSADLAGARLALQASLAQAYFGVRASDADLALLRELSAGYQRSARITQNRYDAGVAPRTDSLQAQLTLRNAQATLASLQRSRAGYEHAIALLLGQAPADFALPVAEWSAAAPAVPPQLPAPLLLRRPDVASAERAVAAAQAQIGVARSAYFPNLSLSASVGAGGAQLAELASAPALLWALGVNLAQTVLDGGARDARVQQARAARDGAVARYRQAALTAMKEVEDQLSVLATLAEQVQHTRAAADAAARIEQQIMNRYQAGLSAYTEVVTAQASALSARRSLLQLQLQRQQAAVALVQALGGGWQAPWATAAPQPATPASAAPS